MQSLGRRYACAVSNQLPLVKPMRKAWRKIINLNVNGYDCNDLQYNVQFLSLCALFRTAFVVTAQASLKRAGSASVFEITRSSIANLVYAPS